MTIRPKRRRFNDATRRKKKRQFLDDRRETNLRDNLVFGDKPKQSSDNNLGLRKHIKIYHSQNLDSILRAPAKAPLLLWSKSSWSDFWNNKDIVFTNYFIFSLNLQMPNHSVHINFDSVVLRNWRWEVGVCVHNLASLISLKYRYHYDSWKEGLGA